MKITALTCLVPFALPGVLAALPQGVAETETAARQASFAAQMSGSRMVGHFTETGSSTSPQEESYTIGKVVKLAKGDDWRVEAKIEYGGKSVTVPIVVQVRWAGDTPMIQVTDLLIPTMGTFSARVAFYGDQYAGMWSGADHGGHMYGRLVHAGAGAGAGVAAVGVQGWSNWRGPDGTGAVPDANPPKVWSEDENVRWKVAIPGLGSSTPIVWGDRIYVTTAVAAASGDAPTPPAAEPPPERGERGRRGGRRGRGGFGRGAAPTTMHEFVVLALNRADGSVVWRTTVAELVPHESGHGTATQASNSPLTDGEHLFAFFGSRGLHCLDMNGDVQWSKEFGKMRTRNQFGEGASPALYGDTIIVNWDHEGESFVVALNKRTGDELWRRDRDEVTSWSTPVIVEVDGRPQAIISATGASRAYDLATGDDVWECSGMTTNAIPTPIHKDGVVYLMSGFRGYALQAIRLSGAKGDLSGTESVLWSHSQGTSYVPSALLYDGFLYFLRSNNGVLSCLDAATGAVHYEGKRLDGVRTIYSSPVGAGGRVYVTSREGTTIVLKLGAEYEELATNELDDGFDATAVIVGDCLLLRGQKHLYCIAESK